MLLAFVSNKWLVLEDDCPARSRLREVAIVSGCVCAMYLLYTTGRSVFLACCSLDFSPGWNARQWRFVVRIMGQVR